MKPLSAYADIISGYHFRGRVETSPEGNLPVLQVKDVASEAPVVAGNLDKITWTDKLPAQLTQKDDVIFLAKGARNSVTWVEDAGILPQSSFLVLRPKEKTILPRYLLWYLRESAQALEYLASNRQGTLVTTISPRVLDQLPLVVPPLDVQHRIVQAHELARQEELLSRKLEELRQKLTQHQLREVLRQWTKEISK